MGTIAVITTGVSSDLKVLEVVRRSGGLRSTKHFMTRKMKSQGFIPEKVYFGNDWSLSGDNPIWILRRKPSRLFRRPTPSAKCERQYVFLIDAEKYHAYQDVIDALEKEIVRC